MKNSQAQIHSLVKCLGRKKFAGSKLSSRIYAAAMITCPGLSLTSAETLIPLIVAAFLADSDNGVYDIEKNASFTKSFPSAGHLREAIFDYAIDCLIDIAIELEKAEHVYMTCDKGNKKGLGHFVKVLSWWDEAMDKVRIFTLDIDASKGNTQGCADAIKYSLQKLHSVLKLAGQLTDSGGGGVLEDLGRALKDRNLCEDFYAVANCTLHAIQLALSNPVKAAFMEGGLEKRNMMQMLHTVYDLQQCMEWQVFKEYMQKAQKWVGQNRNLGESEKPRKPFFTNVSTNDGQQDTTSTNAEQQDEVQECDPHTLCFVKDWHYIRQFVTTVFDDTQSIEKIPAPVLTRWWFVGQCADSCAAHYLIIFVACRMIINDYGTKASPNKIASAL